VEEENKSPKKHNKLSVFLIVLIVIVAVLIVIELATSGISKMFSSVKYALYRNFGIESKEGNTTGNINNYGYITEDKNYLYYMTPTQNGRYIGISKVSKKDLTGEQTVLAEGDWELASLNSYEDYIYFVTLTENDVDEDDTDADEVDNKICRVKKDGSNYEIINDNEFQNYSYKIAVVDKKVYYIGDDQCIWYMDLNGDNKTRLNENATGFELVTDKYIIYNMRSTDEDTTSTVTYIMNRDGSNARAVNGERLFTSVIYEDYIYYITSDRYLHRIKVDGTEDEMLSSNIIYNLNVTENGVFYFNYYMNSDNEVAGLALYRMDLDGKNNKQLYKLNESSNSLCVTNDWVFYLDSDDDQGRMEIVSFDGSQRIILSYLNYSDYYYLDTSTSTTSEDSESSTPDAETENDTTNSEE
jgi:sugar lactone lactonase YvrE